MKVIIIGTSLAGKTTIVRLFKEKGIQKISEIDKELTKLNNGNFPESNEKKLEIAKGVIENVLKSENIIFFTNTDYFTIDDLNQAKNNGFKIIQIEVSLKELLKRNKNRVENEGYSDLSIWLEGMIKYQQNIKNCGLVENIISGEQPVEKVIEDLLSTL